jgi:hypothetical protein
MAYNTIKVKKYMDIVEEFDANAEIYPGMLVEEMSTGKLRAHSTAEGNAIPMFALEDELQGNDIDDAYAADDKVQVWVPNRGEQVYAILADGQNASIGSFLESHGDGYLQVHEPDIMSWESSAGGRSYTDYSNVIVGVALEAVDLSDSSGAESSGALGYNKRILIRVI